MSSILPPGRVPPGHVAAGSFRAQLSARRAMLGVLIDETVPALTPESLDGLDFVVVRAASPFGVVGSVRERYRDRLAVLMLVASEEEVASCYGADAVIAEAGTGLAESAAVDIELSEAGGARLVTSPMAAAAAFGSGANLVVYDLPSMVSDLLAGLGSGRPPARIDQADGTSRPPLVMLSGMLGDETLWDGVAGRLGERVLPIPARIDLDDSVPEIAASVLAAAPRRFALAGHSLGAIVALEVLRQQPDRVTQLALLNASARGPSEQQLAAWTRSQQRVDAGEFGEIAAELAGATLAPAHRQDPGLLAANRAMADTVGADGFLRQLAAQFTRPDSRDSIGDIEVPVLVLSGELDEICPPRLQQELVEGCPNAELVTITGCGHMSPLEAPDAVAAALLGWLAPATPTG